MKPGSYSDMEMVIDSQLIVLCLLKTASDCLLMVCRWGIDWWVGLCLRFEYIIGVMAGVGSGMRP